MNTLYTTQSNPTQFDGDVNRIYFSSLMKHLDSPNLLHRRVGQIMNIKDPKWRAAVDALVGRWGEVAEGVEEAPPLSPRQVAKLQVRVRLVKGALIFSREYVEDDASATKGTSRINSYIAGFAKRGVLQLEIDWTNVFINTGGTFDPLRDQRDGVSLYNTAHPAGGSGLTYGNTVTVGRAFSQAALSQVIGSYFMGGILDDSGEIMPMADVREFDIIVHPSKYLPTLAEVSSLSDTRDYKNSGVINPVGSANGFKFNVIPAPYQTSLTRWTVVAKVGDEGSGLVTVMRVAPSAPEKIIRQNPDQVQYQGRMRYGMLATDPRMVFSDPGA